MSDGSALGAYTGPPQWTLGRVFSCWQLEPAVVAIALIGLLGYAVGVARLRGRGIRWGTGPGVCFASGMLLWVFTTCSGLGVYERFLFTDRAVQAVVLLMVVPLLLAMGAPVTVLVEAGPERYRRRLRAVLTGRLSRTLMFPLVSTVLLIVPPWLLYFTSWYRLSVTTGFYNTVFHVGFVFFGLAYFWPRLQIDPVGRRYHPGVGIVITVAEVVFDAALGVTLVFGSHLLIPDYWQALHRPWGMSVRDDQSWGGAVLWGLGDIAGVPFLIALIAQVVRDEKARTEVVDRELDAQERSPRHAGDGLDEGSPGVPTKPAAAARPWWETDPRFAGRYGPE